MYGNHPEKRKGELYLTNSEQWGENIGYKSRRIGKVAYDVYGNPVSGFVPVFISIKEWHDKTGKFTLDRNFEAVHYFKNPPVWRKKRKVKIRTLGDIHL